MIFYDDFVKKIKAGNIENLKDQYKFGLNLKKTLVHIGVAIPAILTGSFELYMQFAGGFNFKLAIAVLAILLGLYNIKAFLSYKMIIDANNKELFNKQLHVKFVDIDSATLSRRVTPGIKGLIETITIITKNREEIIVPLIMSNKFMFVMVLKEMIGNNFKIIEE